MTRKIVSPSDAFATQTRVTPDRNLIMLNGRFPAFKGPYDIGSYTYVGLCTASSGRLFRKSCSGIIDALWSPGRVGVALAETRGEGYSPELGMIGLGVDMQHCFADQDVWGIMPDLQAASHQLHDDPLLDSLMRTMWLEAEGQGVSSAFMHHCAFRLMSRLRDLDASDSPLRYRVRRFGQREKTMIADYIENRLGEDPAVSDMARLLGRDVRSFTRAFSACFGRTPFSYLTYRRILRAQHLLRHGHNVTSSATAVGYANLSKFSAAFRKEIGLSPSQWQRAVGAANAGR